MACKKTLGVCRDIVVDLCGIGQVAPPAKVEEVPFAAASKPTKDEL